MRGTAPERFWAKVDTSSVCWLWTASLKPNGYAYFRAGLTDADRVYAHRWAYEQLRGPIPDGMEIDHLCRTRHCVNPDHLEPVDHAENHRRRRGIKAGPYDVGDACKNGHDRAAYGAVNANGFRFCTQCRREAVRRHRRNHTHS